MENVPLTFSIIPICLFLVLFLWIFLTVRAKKQPSFLSFSLTAFILIFFLLSVFRNLLVTARYSIILYPMFAILAASALYEARNLLAAKTSLFSRPLCTFGILGLSVLSLVLVQPFYFNYSNLLLSKDTTIHSAWGYGGYEANQYLKTLPNYRNLVIWTDYDGYCPFIESICIKGIDGYKSFQDTKNTKGSVQIDFFLRTKRGGEIYKNYVQTLKESYKIDKKASWNLFIDNKSGNFVSIYKAGNPAGQINTSVQP